MSRFPKTKKLAANVPKCLAARFLVSTYMYVPTFVLYLQAQSISLREVLLLKAVLCVTKLLLEIPSGYIADIFGRKRSLLVGSVMLFIAMLIYSSGETFMVFLLAEVALAFGWSLLSGADAALLYDTLIALGKEDQYQKIEGQMFSASSFAEAFGGLIGGYLAAQYLPAPFLAQAMLYLLFFATAASMVEPPKTDVANPRKALSGF